MIAWVILGRLIHFVFCSLNLLFQKEQLWESWRIKSLYLSTELVQLWGQLYLSVGFKPKAIQQRRCFCLLRPLTRMPTGIQLSEPVTSKRTVLSFQHKLRMYSQQFCKNLCLGITLNYLLPNVVNSKKVIMCKGFFKQ